MKRSQIKVGGGELTQPLLLTPWSFCSVQLPPETLVIQI